MKIKTISTPVAAAIVSLFMLVLNGLDEEFGLYNLTEGQAGFLNELAWAAFAVFGVASAKKKSVGS